MSNVSVVIECGDRRYRVIDNLRELVGGGAEVSRVLSEQIIGRKVLDAARRIEVAMLVLATSNPDGR